MNIRKIAIIADDASINRDILNDALSAEFEILEASNGKEVIKIIEENEDNIAVILLDLIMPEMDGMSVLNYMNKNHLLEEIPVLVMTSDNNSDAESKCLDLGVADFLVKPFNLSIMRHRIRNAIKLFNQKYELEEIVNKQTEQLKNQNEHLKKINEHITDILGNLVEVRNIGSSAHVKRVREYTRVIANCVMENYKEYNLTPELVDIISSASTLHDIGKIAIPDNILLKPDKLTAEEFEIIKQHTTNGADIIENITDIWDDTYQKISYQICRWHHEKYDGSGYPDGLIGDNIPIAAQIVALADCFDALTTDRVYKKGFSIEESYKMILNGECGKFSDKMMSCFLISKEELCKLYYRL